MASSTKSWLIDSPVSLWRKLIQPGIWEYDEEQKHYTCPAENPVPLKKTVVKEKWIWLWTED